MLKQNTITEFSKISSKQFSDLKFLARSNPILNTLILVPKDNKKNIKTFLESFKLLNNTRIKKGMSYIGLDSWAELTKQDLEILYRQERS